MRRTTAILLVLLLTTSVGIVHADPPGRIARLNYAAGAVSFAPAGDPESWTHAVLNRPLTSGDRLWSGDTGRAELHIGSTAIRLDALTSLDVLHLDDNTLHLRLAQGSINVRVRDLAPNETIEIASSTGAVQMRQPGSYSISSEPQSDMSRVLVNFGEAQVLTPAQAVMVPPGQSAIISGRAGIAFAVGAHAPSDEFERWSADRDRREDRVSSTRYVSREMTGYEDLDDHGTWRTLPEYGSVWMPTSLAPGWAPYRHGHWSWISPWGWTWIDDAPWGFAPFHYGRWVRVNDHWGWAPGRLERRPVYAPALVAFVGGSSFGVSVGSGPAVGWFPLGWREPYRPWYRASATHVQRVNLTHAANGTHISSTTIPRYVYGHRPEAVTVVPQHAFVSARPVAQSSVRVSPAELARAEVVRNRLPADPVRASFVREHAAPRPPAHVTAREAVSANPPAGTAAREATPVREWSSSPRSMQTEPRVRWSDRAHDQTPAGARVAPGAPGQPSVPLPSAPAGVISGAPASSSAPSAQPGSRAGFGSRQPDGAARQLDGPGTVHGTPVPGGEPNGRHFRREERAREMPAGAPAVREGGRQRGPRDG